MPTPSTRAASLAVTTAGAAIAAVLAGHAAATLGPGSGLPDDARSVALHVGRQLAPTASQVGIGRAARHGDCAIVEYTWAGPGLIPHAAFRLVDGRWRLHELSTDADHFDVDDPAWGTTCG